jgi:hypothetical protein
MKDNKKYKLSVDDYVVHEKTYYVEAKSVKEAKEKFFRGEWSDCGDDESNYFHKSVVRTVDVVSEPPTTRAGLKPLKPDELVTKEVFVSKDGKRYPY